MKEIADWIERQALSDLVAAARQRGEPAPVTEPTSGALVLRCPSLDGILFNRILGLGEDDALSQSQLADWIGAYRDAGVTRFFVHLYDDPRPAALPAWLEALGVPRYRRSWDKLGRGRGEALPEVSTSLDVRRAGVEDAAQIAALFADGFDLPLAGGRVFASVIGRPGWHVYVAAEGATVAAAGLAFVSGEAAYLAGGVTHRAYRGRGAQLSLMAERCRVALDHDCRVIVSETGAKAPGDPQHSHHNMQRCGLRVFATRHNYAPSGLRWQHGRADPGEQSPAQPR